MVKKRIAIIGAGAAGFFAACRASEFAEADVSIYESSDKVLTKVAISGGGRCNVTHDCEQPAELVKAYARGSKELRNAFNKFSVSDTRAWFAAKGVTLKVEQDGRIFPQSDSSQTIIDCLQTTAQKQGVRLNRKVGVLSLQRQGAEFLLQLRGSTDVVCDRVIICTGSSRSGHSIAESLGHHITELAPSLFTFKIEHQLLAGLAGTSFASAQLRLKLSESKFEELGPVLITHWGLSGPAVLRLSAWAARELARDKYRASLAVNWSGTTSEDQVVNQLIDYKNRNPKQLVSSHANFDLSKKFWARVVELSGIPFDKSYLACTNKELRTLARIVSQSELQITGKGEFKEEFVTCGGVERKEIDFRTMQSKLVPGLYFAGEVIDIDAITGGYNFQNAWSTAWIAATHAVDAGAVQEEAR